jgi:hypothetical protein
MTDKYLTVVSRICTAPLTSDKVTPDLKASVAGNNLSLTYIFQPENLLLYDSGLKICNKAVALLNP